LRGHRSLARWYRAPLSTLATLTDSVIDKVIIEFVSDLYTSAKADSLGSSGFQRTALHCIKKPEADSASEGGRGPLFASLEKGWCISEHVGETGIFGQGLAAR
jgi:hypothetical protein